MVLLRDSAGGRVRENKQAWTELQQRVRDTGRSVVKVGVLSSAVRSRDEGDREDQQLINMAELATIHEFGSEDGGIPERSFLRSTIHENLGDIRALTRKLLVDIFLGKTNETKALKTIGVFVQSKVRGKITDGPFKPNAPATVRMKGSSRPLIDTGQLRRSINFEVSTRGIGGDA